MLFHRSFGKFTYKDESQYFIGTVGYEDVDCDYIDHTYVRAQSPLLDQVIIVYYILLRLLDSTLCWKVFLTLFRICVKR